MGSTESASRFNAQSLAIVTLLFLTFVVLKVYGVITWSWVWVTAPLWVPVALLALGMVCFTALVALVLVMRRPQGGSL